MADQKPTSEKPDGAVGPDGKPRKKRNLPLIVIIALVLALNLVVAGKVFLVGKSGGSKNKKVEKLEVDKTMALDEFLVNLADPGGDSYLKMTMALGLKKGEDPKKLEEKLAPIKDTIITVLSSSTRDQIATEAGKEKLKETLRARINKELKGEKVLKIYFTAFATQ